MVDRRRGPKALRSLSVRARILTAVLIVATAAVSVGGVSLIKVSGVAEAGRAIYTDSYRPERDVATLRETLWMLRWAARSASAVPPAAREPYVKAYEEGRARIDATTRSYLAGPVSQAQREVVTRFMEQWREYDLRKKEADDLGAQGRTTEQQQVVVEKLNPAMKAAQASLDQLSTVSGTLAQQRMADTDAAVRQARITLLAALVACLVLAVGLALVVARSITAPLRRVGEVLDDVARGDLTGHVDIDQDSELGHMSQALNRATSQIRDVFAKIAASSQALAVGSQDLRAASQGLTATAAEATSQVAEMSGATSNVASTIHSVANGAAQMGASIRQISASATKAAQTAGEAVSLAGSTDQIMERLGTSSAEIGNVIKLITSIAEQTNLLALNATIEAARAGESGRGFAVVAGEVKDLAQETARATDDISTRVEAIQSDAGGATQSISDVTEVIGLIDSFQTTIASAVEEQSLTTSTMAGDLERAAADAARISAAIDVVLRSTESTRRSVETVERATSDLATTSAQLNDAVSLFRY